MVRGGPHAQQAVQLLKEWGVNNGRYTCTDNPLYIENMHEFFTTNVDIIAYENYFNQKRYHQLTPSDINPNSSKRCAGTLGRLTPIRLARP